MAQLSGDVALSSGVLFSDYVALPPGLNFLLNFQSEAKPAIRLGSCIDFVTRLLFWTGLAFETPLVVMFSCTLGVVSEGS